MSQKPKSIRRIKKNIPKILPRHVHQGLSDCSGIYGQVSIKVYTEGPVEHDASSTSEEQVGHLAELHTPLQAVVPRGDGLATHQWLLKVPMLGR